MSLDHGHALLELYDRALPQVYGYLRPRCGNEAEAEDVTAEVFLAACDAIRRGQVQEVTVGWLIGIARHKLVDHWRRAEREERRLAAAAVSDPGPAVVVEDPWDARLEASAARAVLATLTPANRAALVLRYLDDLPVPEVADHLGRTVAATEQLLVRARSSFRQRYEAAHDREEGR